MILHLLYKCNIISVFFCVHVISVPAYIITRTFNSSEKLTNAINKLHCKHSLNEPMFYMLSVFRCVLTYVNLKSNTFSVTKCKYSFYIKRWTHVMLPDNFISRWVRVYPATEVHVVALFNVVRVHFSTEVYRRLWYI